MDRSRYKRQQAQSLGHTNIQNFGNSQFVPEVVVPNASVNASNTTQPIPQRPEASLSTPQPAARMDRSAFRAAQTARPMARRVDSAAPRPVVVAPVAAAPAPAAPAPLTPIYVQQAAPQPATAPAPTPINTEFVSVPKPAVPAPVKAKIRRRDDAAAAPVVAAAPVAVAATPRTPISSVMPQMAQVAPVAPAATPAPVAVETPATVDLAEPVAAPAAWLDAIAKDGGAAPVATPDDYTPGKADAIAAKIDATTAKAVAVAKDKLQSVGSIKQQLADRIADRRAQKAAVADEPEEFVADFYEEPAEAAPVIEPTLAEIEQHHQEQLQAEQPRVATGLGPLDMELPEDDEPTQKRSLREAIQNFSVRDTIDRIRSRATRQWVVRGTAVALLLVLTTGGLLAQQSYSNANKVFKGTAGTAAALKEQVDPNMLSGEGSGRINVLVMGRGGGAHDGPDLTDTMMVASIDPINKKTTLLSIPRDLWVTVPGHGVSKINAAYQKGVYAAQGNSVANSTNPEAVKAGFKLADQTVEEVTGLKINYNVVLNFDAFKQAIDTVSGVNVTVPTDLVDPTMAWENNNDPVIARAGTQTMTGAKALQYTRSRETSSDFARGERQRAITLALKEKVASLGTLSNPAKVSGLVNAFGNNVTTDLSVKNAVRLYNITKDITDANTASLDLSSGSTPLVNAANITGQAVVVPKAGLFKYGAIQSHLRTQLKDPYILKEKARVTVLNGTLLAGLATSQGDELKSYGYNVGTTANTPTTGWTQTRIIDLSNGKNKFTKRYLEEHYGVKAQTKMPDNTIAANNADFVIIIGSDKATSPQTATR